MSFKGRLKNSLYDSNQNTLREQYTGVSVTDKKYLTAVLLVGIQLLTKEGKESREERKTEED